MKTITKEQYRINEIRRFNAGTGPFFDTPKEFAESVMNHKPEWFQTQLEWIENGTYGAGACFVLSLVWDYVNQDNRVNKVAHVGKVLLAALTGRPLDAPSWWHKLPPETQAAMTEAVLSWLASDKVFVA